MKIKGVFIFISLIATLIICFNPNRCLLAEEVKQVENEEESGESFLRPQETPVIRSELIYASGYIADSIESSGTVGDSPEGRQVFAMGDNVNLSLYKNGSGVSVGDRFTIFRKPVYVTHPKTRKRVGMLFVPVGVLEIYRVQGGDAAGRIVKSYNYASPGDLIQPYRPASAVTEIVPTVPGLHGYIIESKEGRILNAEYSIVYPDRGTTDGVTPGAVFHVVGEKHDSIIGELKIISAQATTSTALITRSIEPFGIGSKIVTPAK